MECMKGRIRKLKIVWTSKESTHVSKKYIAVSLLLVLYEWKSAFLVTKHCKNG